MDLQDVDICPEPGNALVHRIKNVLPAQANLVDQLPVIEQAFLDRALVAIGRDAKVALGEDDHFVPGNLVLSEGLPHDLFRAAMGVDIGGVPGVQSHIIRMLEEGQRGSLVQDPVLPFGASEGHAAKNDFGDLQPRIAEACVLHVGLGCCYRFGCTNCGEG